MSDVTPGPDRSTTGEVLAAPTPASPAVPGSRASRIPGLHHGLVPVTEGVRLHYTVTGDGEPVLLLHGWPQSWYTWRYVIPLLAVSGRRVYALDTRGLGDSDAPAGGYDLETLAHDVHAVITQLGLTGADGLDIVSHDTGSWIAHAHAVAHPQDVRRLVVCDAHIPGVSPDPPAGYPDTSMVHRQWHFAFNRVEGLPEALIHGKEREFLSWFFGPAKLARTWTIEPDAFEEYLRVFSRPGAVRAGLAYYREAFSPHGLAAAPARRGAAMRMPILAMGGEHADAETLYQTLRPSSPHVEGRVFQGVGHHLPEECPEDVVGAIVDFWAASSARGRGDQSP